MEDNSPVLLGDLFAELKKEGISKGDVATKIGITQSYLSKMLSGEKPITDSFKGGMNKYYHATIKKIGFDWETIANEDEVSYLAKSKLIRNPLLKTVRGHGNDPVKYYDKDFAAGSVVFYEDNVEKPAYEMKIPAFSGCIAFNVFGDSMEHLIKGGSIVFGRKLETWRRYLEFGQIYGIVMKDDQRFLKYIRKSLEDARHCFLLKSENARYDDFEIPKEDIHNIWLIEGWMLKRT